ncbi:hypothetical protein [Nonomuraea basaltis]|nr:hypothetical protein [Nonomuraea basaltis]
MIDSAGFDVPKSERDAHRAAAQPPLGRPGVRLGEQLRQPL